MKRTFDIVGAVIGLIVAAPLMLVIALLVRLTSPGPVIFTQERVGKDGEIFVIYKFRTMVHDQARPHISEDAKHLYATSVGKFLRPSKLDELPQLINVLQGKMSLVGPRPYSCDEIAKAKGYFDLHAERFTVKPGLFGAGKLRGTCRDSEMAHDVSYSSTTFSLTRDALIVALTITAIIRGKIRQTRRQTHA